MSGEAGVSGGVSRSSESAPDGRTGTVRAVCLAVTAVPDAGGRVGSTGIDKRPQPGPVEVGPGGLAGDTICNTKSHGGPDQAVYAYADSDAHHWAGELGRDIPPGSFGENLRMAGMAVSDAVIGERWQVGELGTGPLLEVTSPRSPCATFGRHMGEPQWVKRFTDYGATGAYLRVLRPGRVSAGDPVAVVARPGHGVTIRAWFTRRDPADARRLLDAEASGELRLQDTLRHAAERALGESSATR